MGFLIFAETLFTFKPFYILKAYASIDPFYYGLIYT